MTEAHPQRNPEEAADRAAASGDLAAARDLLEQAARREPDRIGLWIKLAAVRRGCGDVAAAFDALGNALRIDPLDFIALLSRARLYEAAGQGSEAARDYVRALAQRPPEEEIPPHLRALIVHAESVVQAYRADEERVWNEAIAADSSLDSVHLRRLTRFKTNALRQTKVYHSEPTHYHYPGLVEREFHERADFPWLEAFEAATDAIKAEFLALVEETAARAEPYVQYAPDAPVRQWAALNHSMDWTAFHLIQSGREVEANARRCPRTMAALRDLPQPHVAGRSPNAMFSWLKPHTRIPPHTGVSNTRLVCHLPLIVPEGCWFRVGAETRHWNVGEAIIFDDTIEHEAANDSGSPRAVLIVDLWHPGLAAAERAAIARIMEAEERVHGGPL